MATYSFLDTSAAISGPGGTFSLSSGGVAKEGITIARSSDKNSMVIGADGEGMHSLHADESGKVTIRLLKTNPVNALLSQMYRYQKTSSAYWGRNTISVRDPVRGDDGECQEVAFTKHPDVTQAEDGGMIEWVFDAIKIDQVLGDGNPVRQ
jgi:predicted SPOUT superfamily RNA methylase MTH1